MDTNGAAAHLHAVHDQIVGLGAHRAGVGIHKRNVLFHHVGEGMVHGQEAIFLVAPLQQGELGHPQQVIALAVNQVQLLAQAQAQLPHGSQRHVFFVCDNEHRVTGLGGKGLQQALHAVALHGLGKAGTQGSVLVYHSPGEALDMIGLDKFAQRVQLLAAQVACAPGTDGANGVAGGQRLFKNPEAAARNHLAHILYFHTEAGIRLVAAVAGHSVAPGDAPQGKRKLHAHQLFEHMRIRTLDHGLDIFRVDEAMSNWVNSGWRSARPSSSRKQRAT